MGNRPARPDGGRADKARRALRALPLRHVGLTIGPGTALWADFRVMPARQARQYLQAVPAHSPVHM